MGIIGQAPRTAAASAVSPGAPPGPADQSMLCRPARGNEAIIHVRFATGLITVIVWLGVDFRAWPADGCHEPSIRLKLSGPCPKQSQWLRHPQKSQMAPGEEPSGCKGNCRHGLGLPRASALSTTSAGQGDHRVRNGNGSNLTARHTDKPPIPRRDLHNFRGSPLDRLVRARSNRCRLSTARLSTRWSPGGLRGPEGPLDVSSWGWFRA